MLRPSRRQRPGDDRVVVVRLGRHDVHIVRDNGDVAVFVLHFLDALDRVRAVGDVVEVGQGHDRVKVRDRQRRGLRNVDGRSVLAEAGKAAFAGKRHRDRGVRTDLERRDILRGDAQNEVRHGHRDVVGAFDVDFARSVRAAHRAAVGDDGKRMAVRIVAPACAGPERDVLAVHCNAGGPRLRFGVGSIDNSPVWNASDVHVVGSVGKPDVYLALVVRLHARKQVAVIVGHNRADVEVRPSCIDGHAVNVLLVGVLRLHGDVRGGGIQRAAGDRGVGRSAAAAILPGADVGSSVRPPRNDRAAALAVAPRVAVAFAGMPAAAVLAAADAGRPVAASRVHDAVCNRHLSAGLVIPAADARGAAAACRRHIAAVDIDRKASLSA